MELTQSRVQKIWIPVDHRPSLPRSECRRARGRAAGEGAPCAERGHCVEGADPALLCRLPSSGALGRPGAALRAVPASRPGRPPLLPTSSGAGRARRRRCASPGRRRGRCGPTRGLRGTPLGSALLGSRRKRRGTRKRRARWAGSAGRLREPPFRGRVGRDAGVSRGPGPSPGRPPRLLVSQSPFGVDRYLRSPLFPSFPPASFSPLSASSSPPRVSLSSLNLSLLPPPHSILSLCVSLSLCISIFCLFLLLSMYF